MSLLDELFGQILQSEESVKQRFDQLKEGCKYDQSFIKSILLVPSDRKYKCYDMYQVPKCAAVHVLTRREN